MVLIDASFTKTIMINTFIDIKPDTPLHNISEDVFGRDYLAKLIANSIINLSRNDHDSTCIAIYGKWGQGKTSLLNFVKEILNKKISLVEFNPWMLKDENTIIKDFFETISFDAFKDIKEFLSQYGKLISFGVKKTANIFTPIYLPCFENGKIDIKTLGDKLGEDINELTEALTTIDKPLLKQKESICKKIKDTKQHLVVLIDDIDRLDKEEVHTLFRLLRQIADFPNTIYVLAMDPEMVSKSIGEYYGKNTTDGMNFIDKIVQVPIFLPKIPISSIKRELSNFVIPILEEEKKEETEELLNNLSELLSTPRQIKRFCNQVRFMYATLKGEVNTYDLLQLEAVKTISVEAYQRIYDKRDCLFKSINHVLYLIDQKKEEEAVKNRYNSALEYIVESLQENEKNVIKEMLNTMFSHSTFDSVSIMSEKRAQSPTYFYQYFIQGVPEGNLSEREITDFSNILDTAAHSCVSTKITDITNEYGFDNLNRSILNILRRCKDQTRKQRIIYNFCVGLCQSDLADVGTDLFKTNGLFIPSMIVNIFNQSILTVNSDGTIDYHTDVVSKIIKKINEKGKLPFCIELNMLIAEQYRGNSALQRDHIDPLVRKYEELPYEQQLTYKSTEIRRLFLEWKKSSKEGPILYLQKAVSDSSFNAASFICKFINSNCSPVENGQAMSDFVYIFEDNTEILLTRLKNEVLDQTSSTVYAQLNANWKSYLTPI